jgi:cob(I)alamin adenosyltransferase
VRGCIHVYTGEGKGKTTAALGLALRAAGAGLAVFIAQFMKLGEYSEIEALKRFGGAVALEQFGTGRFVRGRPEADDLAAAGRGMARVREVFEGGRHDVVVLDEVNVALAGGIIAAADLFDLLEARPAHVEVVLTGRGAPPALVERADLVTEMKMVKHYFQQGIPARKGIEK